MTRDPVFRDRVGDRGALVDFPADFDGELGGDRADDFDGELGGDRADDFDGEPGGDRADDFDGELGGDLADDFDGEVVDDGLSDEGEIGCDLPTDFEGELGGDLPVDFVGDTGGGRVRFQMDLDVGDLEGESGVLVAAEAFGVMASCRSYAPDVDSFGSFDRNSIRFETLSRNDEGLFVDKAPGLPFGVLATSSLFELSTTLLRCLLKEEPLPSFVVLSFLRRRCCFAPTCWSPFRFFLTSLTSFGRFFLCTRLRIRVRALPFARSSFTSGSSLSVGNLSLRVRVNLLRYRSLSLFRICNLAEGLASPVLDRYNNEGLLRGKSRLEHASARHIVPS
jgi:hypothetical protein